MLKRASLAILFCCIFVVVSQKFRKNQGEVLVARSEVERDIVTSERKLSPNVESTLIARAVKFQGHSPGRRTYFFHLHKAGGTTVCHVARVANGLAAPKRNCNLPGDGPRTLSKGLAGHGNTHWDTELCELRAKVVDDWGLNFHAVERWLDVRLLRGCGRSHFFFATVIREPIARFVSHCRFERTPVDEALAWRSRAPTPTDEEFSAVQRGVAVLDNFYVRSLNGRSVYLDTPFGGLTEEHLLMAAENLAQFDAVLIIERLDESLHQLYHKLNWCMPDKSHTRRSFGKGDDTIVFSKVQLDSIEQINHLDKRLYKFADSLAWALEKKLDTKQEPPRRCKPGGKMRGPVQSPSRAQGREGRSDGRRGGGGRGRGGRGGGRGKRNLGELGGGDT